LSVSAVTLVAVAPMPLSVVSKNSSTDSRSAWPRTNCWSGAPRPGIVISASCTDLSIDSSLGL
jgi:hypothetical protein